MISSPMVLATAPPKKRGAINSQAAAMRRALLGDTALVMIIVETTFAAS
jgi:hypothetical protein